MIGAKFVNDPEKVLSEKQKRIKETSSDFKEGKRERQIKRKKSCKNLKRSFCQRIKIHMMLITNCMKVSDNIRNKVNTDGMMLEAIF